MKFLPSLPCRKACLLAAVLAAIPFSIKAGEGAASLIGNSNMETDADSNSWPDGWPALKTGGSWEAEEGNHFIRMTSPSPGAMVMLYSEIKIPEGVKAIEMTWRQRVTNLTRGSSPWFDARIMVDFLDKGRNKIGGSPKPAASGKDTAGWVDKSTSFLVPDDAGFIKFMPALFNVKSGTFDLDDIVLKPVDPAPLKVAAEAAVSAQAEKLAAAAAAKQAKATASFAAGVPIISNGNFETAGKSPDTAADWAKSGEWLTEEGNHFMRIQSTVPDKTVMLFRSFVLPADIKAFELTFRWRITDLKPGGMPWFDARIMLDIKDAAGKKLSPQPSPPYSRGNTKDGWMERSVSFLVPEGGVTLDLMPSLFNVKKGTLDLDDFVLKPTEPATILAKQKEREAVAAKSRVPVEEPNKANWPPAIRVQGNRLVTVDGGKEVWLQGMNVASLEWSLGGEQVQKSIVVGIDEWKGNVIRLPIKDDYWFGKGSSDGGEAYRKLVDQAVTLASNRGAYLVLDLHCYRAPRKEYLTFWTDAATRYKDHPAVIFDLMNEPHGTSWEVWRDGGFIEEKKKEGDEDAFLTPEEKAHNKNGFESPGMQAMLNTVRATGARNVVLVGGLDYAYQLDGIVNGFGLKDESGNGIIYACHLYPWKKGWQKYLLDAAAIHPILLGEVGADANKMTFMPAEQQEDAETWVPDAIGLIQKYKLNWTGWSFHPKASPRMLLDWDYTPTPVWGQPAKEALSGKQFPPPSRLR
ncbi:MAG: glycoside hydrolase family 5 protein [Luteolibacter sp.]